jgi:hypothetical protein
MRGDEVEKYYRDGHIREIAEYCESVFSTPIGCGCAMNFFADGFLMPTFMRAN